MALRKFIDYARVLKNSRIATEFPDYNYENMVNLVYHPTALLVTNYVIQ